MKKINEQKFGVEIEFYYQPDSLEDIQKEFELNGLVYEDSSQKSQNYNIWQFTTDDSLGRNGCELKSPILTLSKIGDLKKAIDILNKFKCIVRNDCGLHVHLNINKERCNTFKNLYFIYSHFENIFDNLVSENRRLNNNTFCKTLRTKYEIFLNDIYNLKNMKDIYNFYTSFFEENRYYKINFGSYWEINTVEFRHHNSTLDYNEIEFWIKICISILKKAERISKPPKHFISVKSNKKYENDNKQTILLTKYLLKHKPKYISNNYIRKHVFNNDKNIFIRKILNLKTNDVFSFHRVGIKSNIKYEYYEYYDDIDECKDILNHEIVYKVVYNNIKKNLTIIDYKKYMKLNENDFNYLKSKIQKYG